MTDTKNPKEALTLFVDLDGVLADFNKRRDKVLGCNAEGTNTLEPATEELVQLKKRLYAYLEKHPRSFFRQLEVMPGAHQLWRQLENFEPIILTAIPSTFEPGSSNYQAAAEAKQQWCKEHLDLTNPARFHPTTSATKHEAARTASGIPVLIDDRAENCQRWEKEGGLAIHHHEPSQTLDKFRRKLADLKRNEPGGEQGPSR